MRPILMIHGVGCDGASFDRLRGLLEVEGRVCTAPTLFPELRTVDTPPPDISFLVLKDYVEAMAAAARSLEAERGVAPVLLGHSMGGLIVQKLAEAGIGAAGVLVTPAAPPDARVFDPRVLFTFGNIVAANDPTRGYKVWRTGFDWGVLNCVEPSRRAGIHAKARHDSGRVYRDLGQPDQDPNRTAYVDAARVQAPMLSIAAGMDRATPAASVVKVAARYAHVNGSSLISYPEAGHWIIDEPTTPKMAADILDWLGARGL
jgi:pimeloyl-ACP methyl ester carboxylesterase